MTVREIKLIVPGRPIPQPRQSTRIVWPDRQSFWQMCRAAKDPDALLRDLQRSTYSQNYVPKNHPVQAFKQRVAVAAKRTYWGPVLECPLWMSVRFIFARPKHKFWKTKPMPKFLHAAKPDRDNLEKSVCDALEGIIFKNDSQICIGPPEKWYAAGGDAERTEIIIRPIYES